MQRPLRPKNHGGSMSGKGRTRVFAQSVPTGSGAHPAGCRKYSNQKVKPPSRPIVSRLGMSGGTPALPHIHTWGAEEELYLWKDMETEKGDCITWGTPLRLCFDGLQVKPYVNTQVVVTWRETVHRCHQQHIGEISVLLEMLFLGDRTM